jgi:hypothetical protein
MLGHPDTVQDEPRGNPNELLLLQVDLTDEVVFGLGEGRIYWLIDRNDLAEGKLEHVRVVFQQT